jgi:hypothetical protein
MEQGLLLLLVAGSTSLGAALAARVLGAESRGLGSAILLVLELAGISSLFLLANLALGLVIVLSLRRVSSLFLSVYVLKDASLVALSALQGAVFFCWRRREAG